MSEWLCTKDCADAVLKIVAAVSAGGFFTYKVFAGSLAAPTSMKLSATCFRQGEKDKARLEILLERGENFSVEILELQIMIGGGDAIPIKVEYKAPWRTTYTLFPNETLQCSCLIDLESQVSTYVMAVAEVKQQFFPRKSYVFASLHVPPFASAMPVGDDPSLDGA